MGHLAAREGGERSSVDASASDGLEAINIHGRKDTRGVTGRHGSKCSGACSGSSDGATGGSVNSFYVRLFACIVAANAVVTLVRAVSFAYGGLEAAKSLHARLLSCVAFAPMAFFDKTPTARILNRHGLVWLGLSWHGAACMACH